MLSARGRELLFADADGATKFEDLDKLETALNILKKSNIFGITLYLYTYKLTLIVMIIKKNFNMK